VWPHKTVFENVVYPLHIQKVASDEAKTRTLEAIAQVHLDGLEDRYPSQLSGGQQQRVALARALSFEPHALLLDEPLSALDKQIRQRTQLELVALIRRVGVTCIMVTHDQEEAMTMADRIGVMSPKGVLLQVGAPGEVYERPACRYTAQFVGENNLFEGRLERGRLCGDGLPAPLALPPGAGLAEGDAAWLSVRPERLRLARCEPPPAADPVQDNRLAGRVADIAYLGSHSIYHVDVGRGRTITASVPSVHWGDAPAPARDEAVWLAWSGPDGVVLTR
jgi:putrescine transport system ATP-binding protein